MLLRLFVFFCSISGIGQKVGNKKSPCAFRGMWSLPKSDKEEYQVVGVVKDAQISHLGESGGLFFYMPAGPKEQATLQLLVHSKSGDTATANGIRDAAHGLNPDLIVDVTKLEDNLEVWRTPSRIVAALSGALGALALLLASIGVYGVVSYV